MAIFKSFTFYLAIGGVILAVLLVKKISTEPPQAEHFPVAINPYENTIAASGILEAIDKNIEIGIPHSALVKEIFVKVGDTVKPNQLLFRLDDRELMAQLVVQKAHLEVLKTQVARLQSQYKRLESIGDPRAISQEELETKKHDVAVAKAEVEAAEAEVTRTLLLIECLNICAPQKGTILQNNIRKGEFVSAENTAAMILGDIERLQVRADIDEQNACSIFAHCIGTAFPKNNSTLKIPLKFVRIEPLIIPKKSLTGAGDERVDTRVLQVIFSIDPLPSLPLYVGQQVDIFIEKIDGEKIREVEEHS